MKHLRSFNENFNTKIYNSPMDGLTIIKSSDKKYENFFRDGHPKFLIPDFDDQPTDIWISYQDYIERTKGAIYDQNGGEIEDKQIIGNDGLTSVDYVLFELSLESDPDDYKEYRIKIEGYVVEKNDEVFFLATKLTGDL